MHFFFPTDSMEKEHIAGPFFNEIISLRYEIHAQLNHPYRALCDAAYLCMKDDEDSRYYYRRISRVDPKDHLANWLNLQRVSTL